MITLWDLLKPITNAITRAEKSKPARGAKKPQPSARPSPPTLKPTPIKPASLAIAGGTALKPARRARKTQAAQPMQDRYDQVTRDMLAKYDIRVRKWRTSMSGIAWYVTYRDGRVTRLIESPKPKGPMSLAIFLHEIGHHAIGFNVYKPRCLEEYHAWRFSLEQMEALGFTVTDSVKLRVKRSLAYAVAKAQRRGIKSVPEELHAYLPKRSA